MKLNRLTISNIGPYAGTHTINFDDLVNSLYLITGQTGAGKSYLFDSICFALYGETSGGNRQSNDMKSKYSSLTDTAYVELEFEIHGKKYSIHREPKQIRQKPKKTNGVFESKEYPQVSILTMPDDSKVTTNVDKAIIEIIGLEYEEFKMTMMIAQGDFYSLINAKTDEREAIFRKILDTAKFKSFIDDIKAEKDNIEAKVKTANEIIQKNRLEFDFEGELKNKLANPNEITELLLPLVKEQILIDDNTLKNKKDDLNKANDEKMKSNTILTKAQNDNVNLSSYKTHLDSKEKLISEKEEYSKLKGQIELGQKAMKANLVLEERNKAKKDVEEASSRLKKVQNDFDQAIKSQQEHKNDSSLKADLEKKNVEANKALYAEQQKLQDLVSFNSNKQEIAKNTKDIEELNKSLEDDDKKLKELENQRKALEEVINAPSQKDEMNKLLIELNNAQGDLTKSNEIAPKIKNYKLLNEQFIDLMKKASDLDNSVQLKHSLAKDMQEKYDKSIAGILAQDLKEGQQCPVCGSTHHIKLAILGENISKEMVEKANQEEAGAKEEYNKANNAKCAKAVELTNAKDDLSVILGEEVTINNVDELYSNLVLALTKKRQEANKNYELIKNKVEQQEDAKNKDNKLSNDIVTLKGEMKAKNSQANSKNDLIENLKKLIGDKSYLEGLSEEIVQKEISRLENTISDNKDKIESITKNLEEINAKVSKLEGQLTTAKENLESLKQRHSQSEKNVMDALEANKFENEDEVIKNLIPERTLNEWQNSLNNYQTSCLTNETLLKEDISKGYDKLVYQDETALNEDYLTKSKAYDNLNDECGQLISKQNQNIRAYEKLDENFKQNEQLIKQSEEIKMLYNVASGNVSGNKVNFEVYYQLQVFDQILKVASVKFNKMSNGRYELLPGKPQGSGKVGLEIDVRDSYNGEIRPVSGLSGGESFQASMSLALAFAEIIQLRAGGIELNSMFIDEGFGTLDNEMLDSTKKTLLDLGAQTSRKIGIISHIEALEKSIPSKVIVTKSDKGSSFTIVND